MGVGSREIIEESKAVIDGRHVLKRCRCMD